MYNISFKDIRVLPSSIDIKNNDGSKLSEILSKLQTGSLIDATILSPTKDGQARLQTNQGILVVESRFPLNQGDKISLAVSKSKGEVAGNIVSINHKQLESTKTEIIKFIAIERSPVMTHTQVPDEAAVSIKDDSNIPKLFSGKITYLNLNSFSNLSTMYKVLSKAETEAKTSGEIKLVLRTVDSQKRDGITFTGVVSDQNKDGVQLIKTDFGIISTNDTKMSIGQKLYLSIDTVNSQKLPQVDFGLEEKVSSLFNRFTNLSISEGSKLGYNVDTNRQISDNSEVNFKTTQQSTADINKAPFQSPANNVNQQGNSVVSATIENISKMNYLAAIQPNLLIEKSKVDKANTKRSDEVSVDMVDEEVMGSDFASNVTQKKQLTESHIKNLDKVLSLIDANIEEIKKIAQEYSIIKQIANQSVNTSDDNSKWITLFVPFNYNQKIVEHEVKIEKMRSHYLKFIIDIDFEDNQMQLEGLIKFTEGSNKPQSFDMLIRSKKFLSNELTKGIYEIYQTSQEITGIGGNFLYELGADFIDTSN